MRLVLALLAFLAAPSRAEEVDVELLLLVDVSRSMSRAELDLQRSGYAEALRSDSVAAALGRSLTGQIALAYVEWAGETRQRIVHDWTLIRGRDDLDAFAEVLLADFSFTQSRTSISGALRYGAASLDENAFEGLRRVIDISGDGPNNQGGLVTGVRDEVLSRGIVINGLPLMTRDDMGALWRLDDLDDYYAECVIGGPGAFVIPVTEWQDFAASVTRKLVLEIAGITPDRLVLTQLKSPYDCLVGEKMWQRNRQRFDMP